jgi:DNA polymerase-3 subunit epsilon
MLHELLPIVRPLLGVDLEATGVNPETDRIVEIGFEIFAPGQPPREWKTLVNPEMPIPHEATYGNGKGYEGHGITDEMVAGAPRFAQLADNLIKGFTNADFVGYNLRRFDLKLLVNEFQRVGREWSYDTAHVIDPFRLWQIAQPRTLKDAIDYWLDGKPVAVEGDRGTAHCALWDVKNSVAVLASQLMRCEALPRDVRRLHALCAPGYIDGEGKFIWRDGKAVINFGKHRGTPIDMVPRGYFRYMLGKNFSPTVKKICTDALNGVYPEPPAEESDVVPE